MKHKRLYLFFLLIVLLGINFLLLNKYQSVKKNLITKIITPNINQWLLTPTPDVKLTRIILTGDVMLGRTVMTKALSLNDPAYPFRKITEQLKERDIVFINLESPIVDNCPKIETGLIFCASPEMLTGLTLAGIDIATLANNHINNFGQKGVNDTKKYLSERGIEWTDESNLVVKDINNTKFGFLGLNFTFKTPTQKDFNTISESKSRVDVLILGVHWGVEYTTNPTPNQQEWAKRFIENGADVVVGHHPHWIQVREYIEGKPVFYSLGNFVFDQMWSEETKKGIVVELSFRGRELIDEKIKNIYMSSWAQPNFVE